MQFNGRITFTLSVNNILLITASLDTDRSLLIVQVSFIEQNKDGMLLEIQGNSYEIYLPSIR